MDEWRAKVLDTLVENLSNIRAAAMENNTEVTYEDLARLMKAYLSSPSEPITGKQISSLEWGIAPLQGLATLTFDPQRGTQHIQDGLKQTESRTPLEPLLIQAIQQTLHNTGKDISFYCVKSLVNLATASALGSELDSLVMIR